MEPDTKIIEMTIYVSREDEENAETIARSYLKDPNEWKTYNTMYSPQTGEFTINFYQGDLHSDNAW